MRLIRSVVVPVLLLLALIAARPALSAASNVTIDVGGTALTVPAPEGFVVVTESMQPYFDFQQRFVPADNVQFVVLVSAADAEQAARGAIPSSPRKFYIQSARAIVPHAVSRADFDELRSMIKTQTEDMRRKIEAQFPGIAEKINRDLATAYDVDAGLSIGQVVPLPAHHEDERSFSYSMLVNATINNAQGQAEPFQSTVTCALLHLRGKVVFAYANGAREDLEWTRNSVREWAAALIAANPSTPAETAREAAPVTRSFNWRSVGEKALVGAIIGAIGGAVMALVNRRKKKGDPAP